MCPPWLIWPVLWGWAPKVGPATESPGAWFAQAAQGVAGHHQHLTFPSQEGDRSLASYPPLSQTFCETWGRPAPPPRPHRLLYPALTVLYPTLGLEELWARPRWALFPRSQVLTRGVGHTGIQAAQSGPGLEGPRGRGQ